MAIEKERKFLISENAFGFKSLPDNFVKEHCGGKSYHIKQAYVMITESKQLRVRITDDKAASWAYKVDTNVLDERYEFEYPLPLEDAHTMMKTTNLKLEKIRIKTKHNGLDVDIDLYPNNLLIAEIEIPEGYVFTQADIPAYCGPEVTKDKKYSNIDIAIRNQ